MSALPAMQPVQRSPAWPLPHTSLASLSTVMQAFRSNLAANTLVPPGLWQLASMAKLVAMFSDMRMSPQLAEMEVSAVTLRG